MPSSTIRPITYGPNAPGTHSSTAVTADQNRTGRCWPSSQRRNRSGAAGVGIGKDASGGAVAGPARTHASTHPGHRPILACGEG